jgi:hypothetical protein
VFDNLEEDVMALYRRYKNGELEWPGNVGHFSSELGRRLSGLVGHHLLLILFRR